MKIIRTITMIFLIFCIVFTIFVGQNKLTENKTIVDVPEYKGVITMWQIDSFEGGKGSRKQFLLSVARGFEKENQGVLIMVISHTDSSADIALKEGDLPDMISFGGGVEVKNMSEISTKKTISGGMVGDKNYAVSWCRGGYALISNPKITGENGGVNQGEKITEIDELIVSQSAFTQPLSALALEGITAKKVSVYSPLDAYVKFVSGKVGYFLATQRDVFRLTTRGMEFEVQPLEKFNDLYQYISVTTNQEGKRVYCQKFIDYLLQEKVQKRLNEIGLFSPFFQTPYQENALIKMQSLSGFCTISAFTARENLIELQSISLKAVQGDALNLNKIKNALV